MYNYNNSEDEDASNANINYIEEVEFDNKIINNNPKIISKSPDPFIYLDEAEVANNPVTHFAGEALAAAGKNSRSKTGGWHNNTADGKPQFINEKPSWHGGSLKAYIEPKNYNAHELWEKIEKLDALALDVFLVILAHICDKRNQAAYPKLGWFTIHPEQILKFKSFKRYGDDKRKIISDIIDKILLLSELMTDIKNIPYPTKEDPNRKVNVTGCKIFHIGSIITLENNQTLAFKAFAGEWVNYWLQDGGKYYWVSDATRELLELGKSKNEEFAKKIGILLLTIPGGTHCRNKPVTYTIEKILETIGELNQEKFRGKRDSEERSGEHWAARTDRALFGYEDGVDKYHPGAFEILKSINILESFSKDSCYPVPSDRGRGWQDRWLASKITLTTPSASKSVESSDAALINNKKTKKKRFNNKKITGKIFDTETINSIYEAYKSRNLSQQTFADELKISRSTLSNILNKRESPSMELAKRINSFISKPLPE